MRTSSFARRCAYIVTILSVVLSSVVSTPRVSAVQPSALATEPVTAGLFRTTVTLRHATDRARLDKLGVRVLEERGDTAIVLADDAQLETLARLRFEPQASDELGALVNAQGKAWLTQSLQPLLQQASTLQAAVRSAASADSTTAARASLWAAVRSLSVEQVAAVASSISPDTDGDGLTDTEERWWCTDPNNPNSDGDAQNYSDGQEVHALLNFTLPRSVRWGYGPPFGPPAAWPDFNGQDGNPATPACNDGDFDTIPDYAEVFMVGTKVPEESTDHDKFDDGQELFGVTYCPSGVTSCGYGAYPRIEYWNYIPASMPAWVRPPGDNPFVAAFPVPQVSVLEGSWKVDRVTTITTQQGVMSQSSKTYGSEIRRGQNTAIANQVNWNNWEEVSQAVETPLVKQNIVQSVESGRTPASIGLIFQLARVFGPRVAAGVIGRQVVGALAKFGVGEILKGAAGSLLASQLGNILNGNAKNDSTQVQNTIQNSNCSGRRNENWHDNRAFKERS